MSIVHLAAANTLQGLAQAGVTLLAGTIGWILVGGLIVAAVICWFTRRHGAFAVDIAFAGLISFFIFNTTGAQSLMHSIASAL